MVILRREFSPSPAVFSPCPVRARSSNGLAVWSHALRRFSTPWRNLAGQFGPRKPTGKSSWPRSGVAPDPAQTVPSIRFTRADIAKVFAGQLDVQTGKYVLTELHRRRVTGALVDLGLALSEVAEVSEHQTAAALAWLRERYPVDEASAAETYALEQERKLRVAFEQRALNSWVYKKDKTKASSPAEPDGDDAVAAGTQDRDAAGPGAANAQLGRSVDSWHKMKEARWKEQQKEIQQLENQHRQQQEELRLAVVQQQVQLAERRDEKLASWDQLRKNAELDTDSILDANRSWLSRLAYPIVFTAVSVVLALAVLNPSQVNAPLTQLAREAWKPVDKAQLTSPAFVTCAGITAINLVLLLAWRHPRAGWYMNRFFMLSAGDPRTISLVLSVFSHQRWLFHLATNTAILFSLGMPRGIFAACFSLAVHVTIRNFIMASIGASGAIWSLFGAFFTIHPTRDLYLPILDQTVSFESWYACVALVVLELFTIWRTGGLKYDHANHLGGLLAGVAAGTYLKPSRPTPDQNQPHHIPLLVTTHTQSAAPHGSGTAG